ncbi:MAG TPA: hypothetical protein PKD59_15160 [Miltoncostaeaceae bacterium]|nr:hypothetical protein [Miltoncostaeaceae bacterium]
MHALLSRITYANVMATFAVFVALGGTAFAAATIGTRDIQNGAVTAPKVRDGAVTAAKLANGAASAPKIRNGAVTAAKLAAGSVTAAAIGDGTVGTAELANSAVTSAKLAPGSLRADLFAPGQTPGLDPAKLSVRVGNLNLAGGATDTVAVACPAGSHVVSGGYFAPAPVVPGDLSTVPAIGASYPTPPNDDRGYISWSVRASTATGSPANILTYAVCIAP